MQYSFLKSAALAALSTGMVLAQGTAGSSPSDAPSAKEVRGSVTAHLEHMAQALNLTASQKEQARTIFQSAHESAKPIRDELRMNREKLRAAAKEGKSESDIQKLASEQGRLMGKLVAIRTESSAKFYQILTPEQRVKADQMHEQFRERMRARERNSGL